MHLGVSKYIFVDKVVVGRGVWLHVKRIGLKSQYTVFTVKISHFSQGTWFKVPEVPVNLAGAPKAIQISGT